MSYMNRCQMLKHEPDPEISLEILLILLEKECVDKCKVVPVYIKMRTI